MEKYSPNASMVNFFDKLAPERDFWISKNKYYYRQLELLYKRFIPAGKSVLDVGCGTGNLLYSFSPKKGLGVDASFEMIKIAVKKYPNLQFIVMDAHNLEIKNKFDYVVLSNLVGYVDDIWRVFRQIQKACNSQTQVVITNYNYLWQPLMAAAEKMRLKMPDRIQNWLPQEFIAHFLYLAGFKVVTKGKYLHMPINIPPISNILNKILANIPLINRLGLIEYIVAKSEFFQKPQGKDVAVSIIIPTHKEAGNIKNIVERVPQIGSRTELIFVDLPGADATAFVIKETVKKYKGKLHIKYVKQSQKTGKIGAIRLGVRKASGKVIIIYDADMTVPPEDLEKVYLALIERKGDFINGTRMVYPTEKGAMRFLNHLGNMFFARLFTVSFGQHFTDTLCGTKGFWKSDFINFENTKESFDNLDLFGDFYLLLSAYRKKLRIAEVPVRYKTRRYGDTKMNRVRNGLRFLLMFLYFFWNYKILRKSDL